MPLPPLTVAVLLPGVGDQPTVVRPWGHGVRDAVIVIIIIALITNAILVRVQLGTVDDRGAVIRAVLVPVAVTVESKGWGLSGCLAARRSPWEACPLNRTQVHTPTLLRFGELKGQFQGHCIFAGLRAVGYAREERGGIPEWEDCQGRSCCLLGLSRSHLATVLCGRGSCCACRSHLSPLQPQGAQGCPAPPMTALLLECPVPRLTLLPPALHTLLRVTPW